MKPVRLLPFVAVMVLVAAAPPAQAGPNDRYSVITIINESPYRVDYSYRWGEGDNLYNGSIAPNSSYIHWWTFDYAGQDYAPWFYFQPDGTNGFYKMRSFFSPDTKKENGRVYYIRFDQETRSFKVEAKLYTN